MVLTAGFVYIHIRVRIVHCLAAWWRVAAALDIFPLPRPLPRPLRDAAYDLISTNRYRSFGKREACPIPTPELEARFIAYVHVWWRADENLADIL